MSYTIREKFDLIDGKINELGKDSVNYIFLADTHIDEYLLKDENGELTLYEPDERVEHRLSMLVNHLNAVVELANNNDNIDFIAVGGDLINSYSIKGKQSVIDTLNRSLLPFRKSEKPIIMAFGNHDDNGFQTLNPNVTEVKKEWLISDKDWIEKILDIYPFAENRVHDSNYKYSKYYYFDLPVKKTRIIVLDTMDMRRPFDEDGVVTGDMRLKRFWYTNEELDWLANKALTAGEGWNYVFISHMGIENDTSCNCKNGERLRGIIKAFQSRSVYEFGYTDINGCEISVKADYRNLANGKILFYNFGHQHAELIHYSKDIDLWQVSTGCENAWGGAGSGADDKSLPWKIMYERTEGTENETCIDIFSVNNSICRKFNIGPGDDAVMTYKKV